MPAVTKDVLPIWRVMAGHTRPKDGVASSRLCPGHLRLALTQRRRRGWPGHLARRGASRFCPALTKRANLLLGAYRVRGALNEGLDLHHIVFGELAGEVRHALILVWVFEDDILQVHDAFGRGIPQLLDIAAIGDA